MFKKFNPNPKHARVGDCTVRAISKVLRKSWDDVYIELCLQGYKMCDMPSANNVWGKYLIENGFNRYISEGCTVEQFAMCNKGEYVLCLSGHVVALINGDWFDTWNSGQEDVIFYYERR